MYPFKSRHLSVLFPIFLAALLPIAVAQHNSQQNMHDCPKFHKEKADFIIAIVALILSAIAAFANVVQAYISFKDRANRENRLM